MKAPKFNFILLNVLVIFIYSCSVNPDFSENEAIDEEEVSSNTLSIPAGFDFSTDQQVKVVINDATPNVKYDVYAYSSDRYFVGMETYENEEGLMVTDSIFKSDVLNQFIFSGVPYNGVISQTINLPKYYTQLYLRRKENLKYSSVIQNITNKQVSYTGKSATGKSVTGKSSASNVTDYLYCVNGSAELFQVDPLNGNFTYLSNMPMGSFTCAIDQPNKVLYSIGKSSPYPLMKYHIETDAWETVKNLGKGGPRLEYNYRDGLLYFSDANILYTIDPTNGTFINTWTINGLHNNIGGDLAFDNEGELYMCTFSGLYKLELNGDEYSSTRISADNLPFSPTSMTFDSNQELWLSENSSSSNLIIMDTQTGGWKYNYGKSAGNNTNYGRTINDLTTFRVYATNPVEVDTDGDGILDSDDSFPNDADKAFEVFTPSKYGLGTLAFEDLWPSTGDYDFNDMALNYQAIAVLNSQNLAVQLDFTFTVKANGAGYTNGFGIEFENLSPSQIASVTGPVLQHDYVSLNANGTEAGQENAVVILFDNTESMLSKETTISIKFTEPISTNDLGTAPFNPFLIVNKIREKEVHLPNGHTTSLGKKSFEIEGVNKDADGDYISSSGFPWAISIIHDFKVPKEKIAINSAYNFFNDWATSGGINYQDWYKDNPGNRNENLIDN
ncbi:LruC domain-containing protein [Mariniflexile fucanivorans]|uniref:LruC domain-containing protein n=1 Tax=Mariniflexile fucanivorans TaxID=264023 RepID=A0A4R1RHR8_9FLAO|nr:LruC domain-containing protein [Mariniflexile fucanivorans]TCL65611.1 LruC domain-containing protein [Mariniflexile fucanivorans]